MDDLEQTARYGESWAHVYDEWHPFDEDGSAAVSTLTSLAAGGRVLELAIGSGRLALPLQQSGLEVHGIDASPSMVELLRAKPGGNAIPVVIGNFRDVPTEGQYDLIFIAYNTLFALLTQDDQVQCFQNVTAHLADLGCFVVECFVPTPRRLASEGNQVQPWKLTDNEARFHLLQHDPVDQLVHGQTVSINEAEGVRLFRATSATSGRARWT